MSSTAFHSSAAIIDHARCVLAHPLTWVLLLVLASLEIKENYPVSNFPMYAEQKPETDYYFLTDPEGRPLPTREVTKLTSTKFKKMIGKEVKVTAKEPACAHSPIEAHKKAGANILARVRASGAGFYLPASRHRRRMETPVILHWVHVELQDDGTIKRTPLELARG